MMSDSITMAIPGPSASLTAAEPLSAPRTLLQRPEQPDQPMQHRLPADASGLAATIRGPLAPELYDLVVASASASASASSSSSATATPSTSAGAVSTPSASATLSTIGGAVSAPSANTTAPSASSAPAGAMPRSTAWRRKLEEEKVRRAREEGTFTKGYKKFSSFKCRLCGEPKTRQFGHSRFNNVYFCSRTDGRTVEEWLAVKRAEGAAPPPP